MDDLGQGVGESIGDLGGCMLPTSGMLGLLLAIVVVILV